MVLLVQIVNTISKIVKVAKNRRKSFLDKIHKDKGCKIYDCCVNQKKLKHCELCSKLPCKNFDEKDLTKTDEENEKNHQIQYIICVF